MTPNLLCFFFNGPFGSFKPRSVHVRGISVQTSDWSDWLVTHKPPPPPTLQHSVSRQSKIKGIISKDAYAGW